jgi:hypothetical protein
MHRQAIRRVTGGLFADCIGRALCFGHDAGSRCVSGLLIGILEQHRRQLLAHVPFDIIGQRACREGQRMDAVSRPMIYRMHEQIGGFHEAGRLLHRGQRLIAAYRFGVVDGILEQTGTII